MTGPLLLTIRAIAEEWGVSYSHVRNLVISKELGSVQIGRRRMIPRAEANRYIRAHYMQAANEAQDAGEVVNLLEHRQTPA